MPPRRQKRAKTVVDEAFAARPVCPEFVGDDPGSTAGLIVVPRRVDPASLALAAGGAAPRRGQFACSISMGGLVRANSGVPTVAAAYAPIRDKVAAARPRESDAFDEFYRGPLEGQAVVKLLYDLAQRPPSEIVFGGRVSVEGEEDAMSFEPTGDHSGTTFVSMVTHDLVFDWTTGTSDFGLERVTQFERLPHCFRFDRPEVLKAALLDETFAADGAIAAAFERKMESWTFWACAQDGQAGADMLNVSNRHSAEECPPEAPTTHFFPGINFNCDQVGDGDVLILLEHEDGAGDILERPITSIVVLAKRSGQATKPWKPGDGGYYQNADY
mmetsp:Transcript_25557/g.77027  ORF Transcript_25557/g.77027 Transcript_25557/m.77027 type:complete len:329 (+) Transcript_25557:946-1932(+)